MGLAGAGKGTQAHMLKERDGYELVSTGDLLRKYASEEQRQRMETGALLRDEEIFSMIGKALDEVSDLNRCLIDGTPRSIPQADWLLEEAKKRKASIRVVVHLDLPETVVRERLLARGRADDTEDAIKRRFQEYHETTKPLLDHLAQHGVAVVQVNGNQDPDKVHDDIVEALEPYRE